MDILAHRRFFASLKERSIVFDARSMLRRTRQLSALCLHALPFANLASLFREQHLASLAKEEPLVLYKFLGAYLADGFSTRQRLAMANCHYSLIHRFNTSRQSREQSPWLNSLLYDAELEGIRFQIQLRTPELTFFEGDQVLKFMMDDKVMFRLTFSFTPGELSGLNEPVTIFIGGSQGAPNSAAQIRQAAKLHNEVSPAAMLMIALQSLGKNLGIDTITAVSVERHSIPDVQAHPEEHLSTYDELWEIQGAKRQDGLYLFSTTPYEKDILLVPRHHRTRTRKKRLYRQQRYEELSLAWQQLLSHKP